jgi:hypothetical protein
MNDIEGLRRACRTLSGLSLDDKPSLNNFEAQYLKLKESQHYHLYHYLFTLIGLLSYGQIEVIDDFLDHLPPPPDSHEGAIPRRVGWLFTSLFPFPEELEDYVRIRENPSEVSAWFDEYRDKLVWDESLGVYKIRE